MTERLSTAQYIQHRVDPCSSHLCCSRVSYTYSARLCSYVLLNLLARDTVSPLYMNLQVVNSQGCEHVSLSSKEPEPVSSTSGMSEIGACPPLLLLTILQLYHFPSPLPPPINNSSCLFTWCQPLYASCNKVLLYFSWHYTIELKLFSLLFMFVFYLL